MVPKNVAEGAFSVALVSHSLRVLFFITTEKIPLTGSSRDLPPLESYDPSLSDFRCIFRFFYVLFFILIAPIFASFQKVLKLPLVSFNKCLKKALKNVQVESSAHSRERFLMDLRKARESGSQDMSANNKFLDMMRRRLDNPDILSPETLHQLMLSYR